MDCSLPRFSVHGTSQARVLEWVAISFSRGSSRPRDRTCVSCIGRWILCHWTTRETSLFLLCYLFLNFIYFFIFLLIYFNWNLITLQHCGDFCHTLTWISHGCTCVPQFWTSLLSSFPHHSSELSQSTSFGCPASWIEFTLVIYFTHGNIHVSVLFSHIIPPSASPKQSKNLLFISVFILLSCR